MRIITAAYGTALSRRVPYFSGVPCRLQKPFKVNAPQTRRFDLVTAAVRAGVSRHSGGSASFLLRSHEGSYLRFPHPGTQAPFLGPFLGALIDRLLQWVGAGSPNRLANFMALARVEAPILLGPISFVDHSADVLVFGRLLAAHERVGRSATIGRG